MTNKYNIQWRSQIMNINNQNYNGTLNKLLFNKFRKYKIKNIKISLTVYWSIISSQLEILSDFFRFLVFRYLGVEE